MNTLLPLSLAPRTFDEALRFADLVAASDLAPKDYKGKPGNVLVAIQMGVEVGLSPMQALQNISVINGRPSIWGDAALALVRSSPICEDVIETLTGEGDKMIARCIAKRKLTVPVERTFSVEDAKRAGLWSKAGPWQQYPGRMLQQRARGFAIRDAFPDLLRGLVTVEEAQDTPREMVDVTPPHDPQTGEIVDSRELFVSGKAAAEQGKDALQAWWKTLEAHQRKALGGLTGSPMANWKQMAVVVDNKGLDKSASEDALPAAEHEDPQAEPQEGAFGLPVSDDEAACDAILSQVRACTLLAGVDEIKRQWKDRMELLPAAMWRNLMEQIGLHETAIQQQRGAAAPRI